MSWIMKANIVSDNEESVYGNTQLRYKSRKIRFKWEVMK